MSSAPRKYQLERTSTVNVLTFLSECGSITQISYKFCLFFLFPFIHYFSFSFFYRRFFYQTFLKKISWQTNTSMNSWKDNVFVLANLPFSILSRDRTYTQFLVLIASSTCTKNTKFLSFSQLWKAQDLIQSDIIFAKYCSWMLLYKIKRESMIKNEQTWNKNGERVTDELTYIRIYVLQIKASWRVHLSVYCSDFVKLIFFRHR